MAAVSAQKVVSRNIYAGETKRNLRDGFGIYKYSNKFFQYEGEWKEGRKHGHGKLVMADGTYYEGAFCEGEITGHGLKRFSSGGHYTGEFIEGEPMGHGIMTYTNGMVYEGQFHKNQRSGYGIMRAPGPRSGVYEGYFHEDKRHGDGSQTYQYGDITEKYDGEWVADKRHGHGEMTFADGSVYRGQFRSDAMSGQGIMHHSSGVVYEGIWLNNQPRNQPVKLVIVLDPDKPLTIVQGDIFEVKVECHDSEGNVVELDQGRELRLTAGFKITKQTTDSLTQLCTTNSRTSNFASDLVDDLNDTYINTPFGFTVVEYPINNSCVKTLMAEQVRRDLEMPTPITITPQKPVGSIATIVIQDDADSVNIKSDPLPEDIQKATTEMPICAVTSSAPMILENNEIFMPPVVANQRTENGRCEWTVVKFSPPPADYRPYQILDTIKSMKKGNAPKKAASDSDDSEASKKRPILPKPGEYVLIVEDVTEPPFMRVSLETAYALITVTAMKKPPKRQKPKVSLSNKSLAIPHGRKTSKKY